MPNSHRFDIALTKPPYGFPSAGFAISNANAMKSAVNATSPVNAALRWLTCWSAQNASAMKPVKKLPQLKPFYTKLIYPMNLW